ncbi:hypothetical protein HDU97_000822 [Phlyctochytrium planicorne]|nr:hypothetical protein HDU97_000822 [Phlyctochytrium planicorne]
MSEITLQTTDALPNELTEPNATELDDLPPLSFSSFYATWHGHEISYLQTVLAELRKQSDALIFLAGDSSLDNKYWVKDRKEKAINPYTTLLGHMMPDLAFHMTKLLFPSTKIATINCAVEATTIADRNPKLRPQDEFLRENISESDVLVVSIGGNDIALRPSTMTALNLAALVYLNSQKSLDQYPETCFGVSHFINLFRDQVQQYVSRLVEKTKPKLCLLCTIYYPDEKESKSWADKSLAALNYTTSPGKVQAAIRAIFKLATSQIKIDGMKIIPVALYDVLDGSDTADYVARVEPSDIGEPGSSIVKAGWADYQQSIAVRFLHKVGVKKIEDMMEEDGRPLSGIEYLCGKELEEELAKPEGDGVIEKVIQPIQEGKVVDWDAFEAVIRHIIVKELCIRRAMNESPALVAVPIYWGNDDIDRLCQIMFEIINVPGLYIADAPLMAAFGCGVLSAVVVDIGHEVTTITTVIESIVSRQTAMSLPIGGASVAKHFKELLNADTQLVQEYGGPVDDELVNALRESDLCELKPVREAVTDAALKSVKRVDYEFKGKKFTVGASRFKAHEVLFTPEEAGSPTLGLAEAIYNVVLSSTDMLDKRMTLWDNIIITGGLAPIKGLRERIENELTVYLAASETSNEFQGKEIKYVKIPEYFSAFREKPADAVFLGGIIVAKLTLPPGGQHITKADYNEFGPAAARLKQ